MPMYDLPTDHAAPGFWKQNRWWLLPLLIIDALFAAWWFWPRGADTTAAEEAIVTHAEAEPVPPPPPPGIQLGYPTRQTNLLGVASDKVFMPTASGRIESALYGSVRTVKRGSRYLPSFHEGIDIAPMERDRKQRATDPVFAVADGQVLYVNRIAGNSNYGKYVVLGHDDPMGTIYSLYSHLADTEGGLTPGKILRRGDPVGIMGHSSSDPIPVIRAHLHFEIGVINNDRFHVWYKKQKLKPYHGNHHGHNLTGLCPLQVLAWHEKHGRFSMAEFLRDQPSAFTVAFKSGRLPDYFTRYPALWNGDPYRGGAIVITVSEGGVPLSGRNADAAETERIGKQKHTVIEADPDVLGRNGLRLVSSRNGNWSLTSSGERWLEILAYH